METVLLYILGIVVMVVGLAVSIGLHEVGHLVPAKLFGVRVGQYMIGFGPTIWSKKFGETEYGLKAVPLGGYISMSGMYPPAKGESVSRDSSTGFFQTLMQDARSASDQTIEPGHEERVFYKLATWKRVIIMFGGPAMNLVIGVVLYAVVLCGFGIPVVTTTVGSVSACVLSATSERQECASADPAAPGAAAGLKPGDEIISMNGEKITTWEQATAIIRSLPGRSLDIEVRRDGATVQLSAEPLLTERYVVAANGSDYVEDSRGKKITEEVGFLGIGPASAVQQQPLTAVLPAVGDNIVRVGNMILNLPQRLVDIANAAFGPDERDPNGPVSVVGVGRLAGEITSLNTIPVAERAASLLQLLGALNIALFVFNLIPLLPLDGGHIAGAVWEGVRRFFAKLFGRKDPGPVDIARFIPLTLVVIGLIGAMSLLLIYADIVKPISIL
ncbi:MAG: M50 family metallopeptidase [Microbacteriaceae bacterium]